MQCSPTTQPFSFKAQFNWLIMFHGWRDCYNSCLWDAEAGFPALTEMWTRPIPYIISLFSGTFDLSLTNTSDQIPFTTNISFFLSRQILISSKLNIFSLFCSVRHWLVSWLVSHCAVMTGSRQRAKMMLFKTVVDCILVLTASWGILSESMSICPAIAYQLLNYRAFPCDML